MIPEERLLIDNNIHLLNLLYEELCITLNQLHVVDPIKTQDRLEKILGIVVDSEEKLCQAIGSKWTIKRKLWEVEKNENSI